MGVPLLLFSPDFSLDSLSLLSNIVRTREVGSEDALGRYRLGFDDMSCVIDRDMDGGPAFIMKTVEQ